MKKILTYALISILGFGLAACNDEKDVPNPVQDDRIENNEDKPSEDVARPHIPLVLSDQEKAVARQCSQFAIRLLQQPGNEGNQFCSPLGLYMYLALAANGDTSGEIARFLADNTDGIDLNSLNDYAQMVVERLPYADPDVIFESSNSVWYDNSTSLHPNFVNVLDRKSIAETYQRDLSSIDAMNEINSWVEKKTYGMINSIVETPVMSYMAMFNVVYFKGAWSIPFNRTSTRKTPFNNQDGTTTTVNSMFQNSVNLYAKTADAEAVTLGYGAEDVFQMMIIVPNKGVDINNYLLNFDYAKYTELSNSTKTVDLALRFPKFDIKMTASYEEMVGRMGLKLPNAFEGILNVSVPFDGLSQVARVIVNEEGTEAAAVTGGDFGGEIITHEKVVLNVDRPFLFLIREKKGGAILFAGKYVQGC